MKKHSWNLQFLNIEPLNIDAQNTHFLKSTLVNLPLFIIVPEKSQRIKLQLVNLNFLSLAPLKLTLKNVLLLKLNLDDIVLAKSILL